jgi:hypothetical protein
MEKRVANEIRAEMEPPLAAYKAPWPRQTGTVATARVIPLL